MLSGLDVFAGYGLPIIVQDVVSQYSNFIVRTPLTRLGDHTVARGEIDLLLKGSALFELVPVGAQRLVKDRAKHAGGGPKAASLNASFCLAKLSNDAFGNVGGQLSPLCRFWVKAFKHHPRGIRKGNAWVDGEVG